MSGGNLSSLGFDAKTVAPASFDVLPAGEYEAAIVFSAMAPTKSGNGRFLELELQILQGPYKGRKLFDRLNLENPNAKAVEIARGTLSAICRAVGVLTPNDSSELHDKPLKVKVVATHDPQYGDKNEIKAYRPASPTTIGKQETIQALQTAGPPDDEIPF